jgi:hypothetical protein
MKAITTRIFALLLVLLSAVAGKAQQIVFSEDFDHYSQINFTYPWRVETSVNAFPWRCDLAYQVYGIGFFFNNPTKLAIVTTAAQGPDTNDLLISPAIGFATVQGAYLKYDSYFRKQTSGGKTETARVEVSTDNGSSWTVLKNAPVSSGPDMTTSYADLSAYNNVSSLRLGFRYSDSGRGMFGWMVDNIKVFVPAQHDVALIHAYPEDTLLGYNVVSSSLSLNGTVMNMGAAYLTSFTVNYQEGHGPINSYAVTGVNIAPFDTLAFIHSVPYTVSTLGGHQIRMWVSTALDTNTTNDSLNIMLHGAMFMPDKIVAVEEGAATWNGFGPRGDVYMHALAVGDHPPTLISVHSSDPMGNDVYRDFLFSLDRNFIPYFLFDRGKAIRPEEFFRQYDAVRQRFGFADVVLSGTSSSTNVSVVAKVRPAVDLTGDYRLALVITEDGVTGTDTGYSQWNFYKQQIYGAIGPMGGYENLPRIVPAAQMRYDFVARSISPSPDGQTGCLPTTMVAGNTYTCTLQGTKATDWKRDKLSVAVLLIRNSDSAVLNSKKVKLTALDVQNIAISSPVLKVFPNPATETATVEYRLERPAVVSMEVSDITGRSVLSNASKSLEQGSHSQMLKTAGWPSGVYFISVQVDGTKEVVKLVVTY